MTRSRTTFDRSHRRTARRAFTLIEIIVVVTIIAILASLVAPRLLTQIGRSKGMAAESECASIAQQVKIWMADQGLSRLPDDFDLYLLTEGSDPLLQSKDLLDPWDNPYMVIVPGEVNLDFDIVSYGANGEPGGEGEDEDHTN